MTLTYTNGDLVGKYLTGTAADPILIALTDYPGLRSVALSHCSFVTIIGGGCEIRAAAGDTGARLSITGCDNIRASDARVFGHPAAETYLSFGIPEWTACTDGVFASGPAITIERVSVLAVSNGFCLDSTGGLGADISVVGFCRDSIRLHGDDCEMLRPTVVDAFGIDANHTDCLQMFPFRGAPQRNLRVRGGLFLPCLNTRGHPLYRAAQGISCFDGNPTDTQIEGNWLLGYDANGITVLGGVGTAICDNHLEITVPHKSGTKMIGPRIRIGLAKPQDGSQEPTAFTVTGNIGFVSTAPFVGDVANNVTRDPTQADYLHWVADWRGGVMPPEYAGPGGAPVAAPVPPPVVALPVVPPAPTPVVTPSPVLTPDPVPAPEPDPVPLPDPLPDPVPPPVVIPDPVPEPDPAPEPDPVPVPVPAPEPDPVPLPDPVPTPDPIPVPAPEPLPVVVAPVPILPVPEPAAEQPVSLPTDGSNAATIATLREIAAKATARADWLETQS